MCISRYTNASAYKRFVIIAAVAAWQELERVNIKSMKNVTHMKTKQETKAKKKITKHSKQWHRNIYIYHFNLLENACETYFCPVNWNCLSLCRVCLFPCTKSNIALETTSIQRQIDIYYECSTVIAIVLVVQTFQNRRMKKGKHI